MINVTKIVLETKSKYIDKQFLVDSVNCLLRTESCLENVGVIDNGDYVPIIGLYPVLI